MVNEITFPSSTENHQILQLSTSHVHQKRDEARGLTELVNLIREFVLNSSFWPLEKSSRSVLIESFLLLMPTKISHADQSSSRNSISFQFKSIQHSTMTVEPRTCAGNCISCRFWSQLKCDRPIQIPNSPSHQIAAVLPVCDITGQWTLPNNSSNRNSKISLHRTPGQIGLKLKNYSPG
jgi:hypothetical protein